MNINSGLTSENPTSQTPLLDAMERNSVPSLINNTVTQRKSSLTNRKSKLKGRWGMTLDEIVMEEKAMASASNEDK